MTEEVTNFHKFKFELGILRHLAPQSEVFRRRFSLRVESRKRFLEIERYGSIAKQEETGEGSIADLLLAREGRRRRERRQDTGELGSCNRRRVS